MFTKEELEKRRDQLKSDITMITSQYHAVIGRLSEVELLLSKAESFVKEVDTKVEDVVNTVVDAISE